MLVEAVGHKYFKLFANCIPVKGASRSIICDVQRGRYHFITNDLLFILESQDTMKIDDIVSYYGNENKEILNEYFSFLTSEEYIFFCELEERDFFPKLDLIWEDPSVITNAIIDVDLTSNHNYSEIFGQLDRLGCRNLQFRFFSEISLQALISILELLELSCITSVELLIPYCENIDNEEIIQFACHNLRVNLIVVHSHNITKKLEDTRLPYCYIFLTDDVIRDESHCGFISKDYFSIGIEMFSEAQSYNTCLNRKISIDKSGFIKNCPSMPNSFGHIKNDSLEEVVENPDFKKIWNINKDQISICKDCEFRYICTDCRAFTIDGLTFSKPAKCSYDPYSEQWEAPPISTGVSVEG